MNYLIEEQAANLENFYSKLTLEDLIEFIEFSIALEKENQIFENEMYQLK